MTCRPDSPSTARIVCLTSLSFLIVLSLGALGCKSYTTGLQKGVARADETSVITALRTVAIAQQSYAATHEGNFGTFLELAEGSYLDSRFHSDAPEMHGYVFTMKVGDKTFSCSADPVNSGAQQGRHFYVDSSSPTVRANPTQPASDKDEALQF